MNWFDIVTHPGIIPRVYIYIFNMNINIGGLFNMTLDEWKEKNRQEEEATEEKLRIEREYTLMFTKCENMDECREKYNEIYKQLDETGDYEKMKHLWKVVHRLNIRIKK